VIFVSDKSIRMDKFYKNKNKPGHFIPSLMVLYGVSENNWKGSMDIRHVNKAGSNYRGAVHLQSRVDTGCP
jgi:hypothetical protein